MERSTNRSIVAERRIRSGERHVDLRVAALSDGTVEIAHVHSPRADVERVENALVLNPSRAGQIARSTQRVTSSLATSIELERIDDTIEEQFLAGEYFDTTEGGIGVLALALEGSPIIRIEVVGSGGLELPWLRALELIPILDVIAGTAANV
jgi:hypothetical protein